MKYIILAIYLFISISVNAQESNESLPDSESNSSQSLETKTMTREEFFKRVNEEGGWIVSKSDPIILTNETTGDDFTPLGKSISNLVENKIIPQALDRNALGEVLIISQLTPPAEPTLAWELGVYKTEKEMMEDIEEYSKKAWHPTGMDVNDDGAFVLYTKKNELINGGRLVKIKEFEELGESIQMHYNRGFLPAALTTFRDSLWIFFTRSYVRNEEDNSLVEKDISNIDIIIKSVKKEDMNSTLVEVLTKKNSILVDATFTIDSKILMVFTVENE